MHFFSARSYHAKIIGATLAIALVTSSCHAQPDAALMQKIQALVMANKANLAAVKGGEFQMGDFGETQSEEKLPYTRGTDNKPLHTVKLSNFAIGKYKVTYSDYDTYATLKGLPLASTEKDINIMDRNFYRKMPKSASFPAPVMWEQAHSYCQWLGEQLGQSMDLPTEAQWEYAARARGKFFIFATDNGLTDPGRNTPSDDEVEKLSNGDSHAPIPVGLYAPNPLGLYDMDDNGREWVGDWYAADYYSHSPEQDPPGPANGIKKVLRSATNVESPAMTMARDSAKPDGHQENDEITNKELGITEPTRNGNAFRCASSIINTQK